MNLYPSEFEEQATLIEWWRLESRYYRIDERLLFAIPNGGLRSKITGSRMKREGVRRGIPDLFLAIPSGKYSGLFIEMKTQVGKLTDDQKEVIRILKAQGYKCIVCKGFDEAKKNILKYIAEDL